MRRYPMQTWRLIDTEGNNGFYNMAVDEAMAIACGEGKVPPTLRFYTWDPPCISIGYFQKVDSVLPSREGMEIVRRPTGGRAVYHGSDLSYSVVSGTENRLFSKNVRASYYTIAEALICGLKHLGITPDPIGEKPASHSRHHPGRQKADGPGNYTLSTYCFDMALGHEISVNGRKLIGSAQRRWPEVILQHGTILTTRSSSGNGAISISLSEIIGEVPDVKEMISALSGGFCETLEINLTAGELTGYERELAERLIQGKYSEFTPSAS